jgi:hypothetical protein
VAQVAVETGIAPQALLDAPEGIFEAMVDVLQTKADESRKQNRR